jgi:Tfp pilus assembly protein FimT
MNSVANRLKKSRSENVDARNELSRLSEWRGNVLRRTGKLGRQLLSWRGKDNCN